MKLFLKFDRLTVRLAVGITLLVILPLAVGLYILSHQHFNRTLETRRQAAESQSRILEATLRHQMLEKDPEWLAALLKEMGDQPGVENAMILDHDGVIRFANRPALVDREISRDSPACLPCHSKKPEERDRWVVLREDVDPHGQAGEGRSARKMLRTVLPIENRKECHECHDSEERLNGILILDVSLAEVYEQLRRDRVWIVAGIGGLALVLLTGVGLIVRSLVLVRLARLGRTARTIADGNLDQRAVVEGRDVIASLAEDFNNMTGAVSRLVAEVREQEFQLVSVMNSLDDGLIVIDRDFRVVASNRSFCRRLGSHPEALRGRCCHDLIENAPPCCSSMKSAAAEAQCPAAKCLENGEVQRMVFEIAADGDGGALVTEVYASPVYDANGDVAQVVEIWRDISERVREEERLAEIERLVSLGVLASGFSHQINTPLASILTAAEGVLGRIDDRAAAEQSAEALLPAIQEQATIVRGEVLRCRKITEQFLRFSRGIPPSTELIDLRQVVQSVITLVAPTAREAHAELRLEGDAAVPAVNANSEVVQHVMLNLLVNAIQSFDERGGDIVVRFLENDGLQANEDVRIQIEDTGCGISPEARKYLFKPFHSRKPEGTGLGLFLSRSFMQRFGGDIRLVESRAGGGSCFEIIFPRANVSLNEPMEESRSRIGD